MTDWSTVASLATAAGTLVLAVATFASVRSANRAARLAEETLLASMRPLVMPTRTDDPPLKVGFADDHWVRVPGGAGTIEITEEATYLTMSLRNAGTGIAVLHGWRIDPVSEPGATERPDLDSFRRLSRDLYIPAGDIYFWQGALRDREDPDWTVVEKNVASGHRTYVDLLYGDQYGRQRVIGRFLLVPRQDGLFLLSVVRNWNVDRPEPR